MNVGDGGRKEGRKGGVDGGEGRGRESEKGIFDVQRWLQTCQKPIKIKVKNRSPRGERWVIILKEKK